MKNALLIVNIILVVAVGTLFFLYFSKMSPVKIGASVVNGPVSEEEQPFRIAYFEMDSIENNYVFSKEAREKIRSKEEELNRRLKTIMDKYNKLWEESNRMQATLSEDEKMKRNMNLEELKETLRNTQQMNGAEIQNEIFRYRQKILVELQGFLKKYSAEKGYAFVMASGSTTEDALYYKDSLYNITADVVQGLNQLYKPKK